MTIEAGVLSLKITETGADAVLAKLGQIDAKARTLGQATQGALFNAPSATGINGQLGQMSLNLTKVGQAANAAAPAVEKHSAATAQAAKNSASLATQLGAQVVGYYGLNQAVSAAVRIFDEFNAAADNQANAQRKLASIARLTGTSMESLQGVAAHARSEFHLSTASAQDLTGQFAKLAFRAGDVTQTGKLMSAWMDLGAANGLTLDQTLQALTTTLGGNDEGLNRLGLMNPGQIWKKWAEAAGTTVAQLTEQQKWQALINEAVEQGTKVQGEHAKSLETTLGKQNAFTESLKEFNAHIGASGAGIRSWAYSIGTTLIDSFVNADKWLDKMAAKSSGWIRGLFGGEAPAAATPFLRQGPPAPRAAIATSAAPLSAAERAAAKAVQDKIAKALGFDLGNIPLADITAGGPRVGMPGLLGTDKDGKMKGEKAFGLANVVDKGFDALTAKIEERRQQLGALMQGVGDTIGGALAAGFTAAFTGGNFFAEIGKALLQGLGSMVVQLGSSMLTYGLLMAVGAPLLMATPFAAQALSAPAAIAAGTGLIALGAGMGALGGGGGKGGGGGGGSTGAQRPPEQNEFAVAFDPDRKLRKSSGSAVQGRSRGLSNGPMPDARPVVHIGTINSLSPDDAKWQRAVAETYTNARNRGLVRNG
jgi:hypothetical protein